MSRVAFILLPLCLLAMVASCAKPNPVTIQLRKDNQQLQNKVEALRQQDQANRVRIDALQQQIGTVPTLPQSRLDQMFTVQGIEIGRHSGAFTPDPDKPAEQALKIYLAPVDESGDAMKATGQVTIEAFDLNLAHNNRIGRWEFTPQSLKDAWRSLGPLRAFVLVVPLQSTPAHSDVTVKVTFRDELTGRTYKAIKDIRLTPPPASTQPAGGA